MRALWVMAALGLVSCGLASCSGGLASKTETAVNAVAAKSGLPAQTLQEGECGIFLWSNDEKRTFTFFHREGRADGLVYWDERAVDISTAAVTAGLSDVRNFSLTFANAAQNPFQVRGLVGESIDGGRRIESAAITGQTSDGWEQIVPVSGVYACR